MERTMHDPDDLRTRDPRTNPIPIADDERFARIMSVWLDWLRRKARELASSDAVGGVRD